MLRMGPAMGILHANADGLDQDTLGGFPPPAWQAEPAGLACDATSSVFPAFRWKLCLTPPSSVMARLFGKPLSNVSKGFSGICAHFRHSTGVAEVPCGREGRSNTPK